jgi:adsorption protein B
MSGAGNDPRIRGVIHENAGPTTKADCLNRLYAALGDDERRYGYRFKSIVLHGSEQVVPVVHVFLPQKPANFCSLLAAA